MTNWRPRTNSYLVPKPRSYIALITKSCEKHGHKFSLRSCEVCNPFQLVLEGVE